MATTWSRAESPAFVKASRIPQQLCGGFSGPSRFGYDEYGGQFQIQSGQCFGEGVGVDIVEYCQAAGIFRAQGIDQSQSSEGGSTDAEEQDLMICGHGFSDRFDEVEV